MAYSLPCHLPDAIGAGQISLPGLLPVGHQFIEESSQTDKEDARQRRPAALILIQTQSGHLVDHRLLVVPVVLVACHSDFLIDNPVFEQTGTPGHHFARQLTVIVVFFTPSFFTTGYGAGKVLE